MVMKLKILDNVRSRFLSLLNAIGTFLNQTPEKVPARSGGGTRRMFSAPLRNRGLQKLKNKGAYNYKGSGYMGKGNINTQATTFNRLRKDGARGREQ